MLLQIMVTYWFNQFTAMKKEKKTGALIKGIRFYPVLLMATSLVLAFFTCYIITAKKNAIDPVHFIKNHTFDHSLPLVERTGSIPSIILNHMKNFDSRPDYSGYNPDQNDLIIIGNSINLLPGNIRKILNSHLVGIYFINDFLGSGLTDWITDEKGNFYCYMVINPVSLKADLSDYITQKEATCFKNDSETIKISIDCGREHKDFLYILLHESVHVVDYVTYITPYVEDAVLPFRGEIPDSTPFTEKIWEGYDRPVQDFAMRKQITFYGLNKGPKISITDAVKLYKDLSETPFVSLYSTMNWAEDSAEFLTFYHLSAVMGKPYKINVFNKNTHLYSCEPMSNPLVKKRIGTINFFYKQDQ